VNRADRILVVGAPLSGWCTSLDDSPDPVFRGRTLGDGVSIDPTVGEVRAPFDGEVLTLPKGRHAINLRSDTGAEFLIHVGIDTVGLGGEGFEAHVRAGERIMAGQLLLSFDLETLLRGATSLRSPVLLLHSDRHTLRDLRAEGMVEAGEVIFEVHSTVADREADVVPEAPHQELHGEPLRRTVAIGLAHGIHARPAAQLIEAMRSLDAQVSLQHGERTADARSAVALMALNTSQGARVTVMATGPDAQQALDAVVAGLEPLAESGSEPLAPPLSPPHGEDRANAPPAPGSVLRAVPASPGLAQGSAVMLRQLEVTGPVAAGSPEDEAAALHSAIAAVREWLQARAEGPGTAAEIARAHLALLADPQVARRAEESLEQGQAAATAWQRAVEEAVGLLLRIEDARVRERADDLRDIELRVLRALAGEDPAQTVELPDRAVVVADNLLPSQLLEMDRECLAGICLAGGGATSHVALLAGSQRIPMLVAAGVEVLSIEAGSELLIDADLGELHVSPAPETTSRFAARITREAGRHAEEAQGAQLPCITADGVRIHVHANIASAADAREAVACGAEGCGLLRTEFLFMQRDQAPGVQEQLRAYAEISTALGDRPLIVRTLDAGGDKPIAYLRQKPEENPALGVRGIRLGLAHPELLEAQLQALLLLEHPLPVQVMLPMVASVSEVEAVKAILARLGDGGARPAPRLGVMIETPAAALIADRLAGLVDFFSIGTNDLSQYTLCMDRGEPALARQLDALHPAVLRLIRQAVDAAEQTGIPVAVCGGAAGDPLAAPLLLGLGIRELSMPAGLIARQKARLRQVSVEQCEDLAARALGQGSAAAVRAMLREWIDGVSNADQRTDP